jgi:adenylosuccinate synthase
LLLDILKNLALVGTSTQEIDIEVAIRAYADTRDVYEVATLLSQSDRVRGWREKASDAQNWNEYVINAKKYVRMIQDKASERFQMRKPENLKQKEIFKQNRRVKLRKQHIISRR